MSDAQVMEKVKQILQADFRVPAEKIVPEASFRGTLGMDSLDAVDLIYLLSKEFGLKPEVEAFRDLHTVQKVVDFLSARTQGKGP